jgi:hypothetical protein
MNGVPQLGHAISSSATRVSQLVQGHVGAATGSITAVATEARAAAGSVGWAGTGADSTGAENTGGAEGAGAIGAESTGAENTGAGAIGAAMVASGVVGSGVVGSGLTAAGVCTPSWAKHSVHQAASAGTEASQDGHRTVVTEVVSAGQRPS